MVYSLSPLLKLAFVNSTNKPLVGGKLYTYLVETTTPLATYSDDAGTPNTNPIILDANGECNLYLDDDKVYRLILKDANDVTYFDKDRVSSIGGGDYKVLTFNTIADLRLKLAAKRSQWRKHQVIIRLVMVVEILFIGILQAVRQITAAQLLSQLLWLVQGVGLLLMLTQLMSVSLARRATAQQMTQTLFSQR